MNNLIKRILSSIIILPLAIYFISQGSLLLLFFTVISFAIAYREWHLMMKNNYLKIFGFISLIISFSCFYILSLDLTKCLFVILICASTDIGGYSFGKIFKGPKLTKISPNKTYSGMIGSYLLSLMSVIIFSILIDNLKEDFKLVVIAILVSTISQIGDLIISYFKRLSKIKNTGTIIPGHGGLLDRIDGMIFAFPIYYIFELSGYGII